MTKGKKELSLQEIGYSIAELIYIMGDYFIKYGTLEKNTEINKIFDVFKDPEDFLMIIREMPDEVGKEFGALIFSITKIMATKKDFNLMTPEEKIETGKELKKIARRMRRLIKKIKEGD